MNNKAINPQAIVALQDALASIYWYKDDLKNFLNSVLGDSPLLVPLNWNHYKRDIVQELIEKMTSNQTRYRQELINLMVAAADMKDFSHLEQLDDGEKKAANARRAIRSLKTYVAGHEFISSEREAAEAKKQAHLLRMQKVTSTKASLEELYSEYGRWVTSSNSQARGYALEKLLRQLFEIFDLDPKASFRVEGEQIDGSFVFENTDFLFEAKWEKIPISADALDSFAMKVERKFDAKGVFMSINGFSPEGVTAHSASKKVLLLMDGSDLVAVLDRRIDLKDMLARKRRHAARTGEIYLKYGDM